ncbi:MAG TPA: hypothetical protein VGN28_12775 [Blastococcus sp.]|nr:hypothetical protein [Blastococcus sp.]
MSDDRIQSPRDGGPLSKAGERSSRYGAVEVLLSWQALSGVVSTPLPVIAERLGLQIEHSFNEQHGCDFAYLETNEDAYTLVSWDPSPDVEVWAALRPNDHGSGDLPAGRAEFRRFLQLAALPVSDVVVPRPLRGA